jgi:hypothetical protein
LVVHTFCINDARLTDIKTYCPSFQAQRVKRGKQFLLECLWNENEGIVTFRNVGKQFVQGQFTSRNIWILSITPARDDNIKPLNVKLNPICHLVALLGAHHIWHVRGLRVKFWILYVVHNFIIVVSLKHCKFHIITIHCSLNINKVQFSGKSEQFFKYTSYCPWVRRLLKYVIQQAVSVNLHILLLLYIIGDRGSTVVKVLRYSWETAVAQCLRYCATNRNVAVSIPDGVIGIFSLT